jgi:hypothetical protein
MNDAQDAWNQRVKGEFGGKQENALYTKIGEKMARESVFLSISGLKI